MGSAGGSDVGHHGGSRVTNDQEVSGGATAMPCTEVGNLEEGCNGGRENQKSLILPVLLFT